MLKLDAKETSIIPEQFLSSAASGQSSSKSHTHALGMQGPALGHMNMLLRHEVAARDKTMMTSYFTAVCTSI